MPKLPDYTALGETAPPQAAQGAVGYSTPDATAPGRAMAAVGAEVGQAANIVAETNQRQDAMVAEAAVNQLHAQSLDLQDSETGFKRVRGSGAVGPQFLQGFQQKFTDAATGIEQSLSNDYQRRLFQQRAPVVGLQFKSALLSHQATETNTFNEQTENDTIDNARRQIFTNPGDPQAVASGMTRVNWAIDQKAQRLGWNAEVTDETKRKFQEKVFEDSAMIAVERDPFGALAAINKRMGIGGDAGPSGITAIDGINVFELVKLRHRADSYVTQAQNALKADSEKRLKDAQTSTNELQQFTLSGQTVSPAYEQQVLLKTTGTPFEAPARALIQASYAGGTHGSLTLPQQQEHLRQIDAAIAQSGSDPESSKLVQHARTITETQATAYKNDPWAAATRFNHQPNVQPQNITSADQVPKLVADRLPLMTGVENAAGYAVSPLQPAEADAFAQKLQTLPPEARAEVLSQTGEQLSAPRVAALADQLDKKDKPLALALKMGADRTTAGRAASSLVLLGAQALTDKTVKKDDQALAGWKAEIAGLVRGTLGDDAAENDVIDAAYYVRAAQDREGAAPSGYKPGSGASDAVAMVMGRPIERAGLKTVLPRGMSEHDFDAGLASYTPERLRELAPGGQVFVRGTPVKVEQIAAHLSEYGLKRDGSGRYVPVVRNAPITLDAQGQNMLRLDVR